MNLRHALVVSLAALFAIPALALANGPMAEDPATGNNSGKMSPERQKWTQQRLEHLKRRREQHQHHGTDAIDIYSGIQTMNDPFAQTQADRRREAFNHQREIDAIEYLAIKKERGELSPAGQKKLNQLIRHVRTEGH